MNERKKSKFSYNHPCKVLKNLPERSAGAKLIHRPMMKDKEARNEIIRYGSSSMQKTEDNDPIKPFPSSTFTYNH